MGINVEKFEYAPAEKHNNIKWMLNLAIRYNGDFLKILNPQNPSSNFNQPDYLERFRTAFRQMPSTSTGVLELLFEWEQANYILETEEQLLRPLYFAQVSGDCDDQTIATVAYLVFAGFQHEQIRIVEGGMNPDSYEHIFVKLVNPELYIDPLPGNQFGVASVPYQREWTLEQIAKF